MKTWSTPVRPVQSNIIPCICGNKTFKPALDCEGFNYVRCKSCGLTQMNPQPQKTEIIERYSKTFGKDYLSYELENESAFLKLQQLALEDAEFFKLEKALFLRAASGAGFASGASFASGAEPPSVLDVGCATGALIAFLRERKWRVTGIEISDCADYARKERNLDVRRIPLEENNFPSAHFNVLLASHLIEHLNDPLSFLKEARRILKPDGRIFITTPNIAGFQARFYKGHWRSAIFDHLYLFSALTLKKNLIDVGFKVEKISVWGGLAEGLAPRWVKKTADFLAKRLGFGDVMIVRAVAN